MDRKNVLDMTDAELDAALTEIDRELRTESDRIPGPGASRVDEVLRETPG
jgi:hypothetical protein